MQFLYPSLTWGFLLVGVPILVHLINMLRHRKQKWAAMDFLLESYRRNRRWVMLKQWLLLAARILAMLLLVAMLAKWVSGSRLLGMLKSQTTHHYILLDDSYSMADIDQGETSYNRGLRALSGLVRSIAGQSGQQDNITLLRLSRAALATRGSADDARVDVAADLNAQSVPRDPARLLDRLNATQPTALQLSPEDAFALITPMIAANNDERAEVYLLTDLRRNEFGEPEALRNKLASLVDNAAAIHLIDCAKDSTGNLSVASVEPEQEVWAAGVPLMVRFQVRNQSTQVARNVVVKVRSVSYVEGVTAPRVDSVYSGEILDLPPVVIEQIEPGETVTRQVQVVFGIAGKHVVEITLPEDPLPTDNKRWCVIGIRESQRVLLVDGEADRSNAFYFQTVLSPDSRLRTGMTAELADAAYLRDVPAEILGQFDVIALLDVPRLERQAINKLQEFCSAGGGLFISCGRNTNLQFVNEELYQGGEGLFPLELTGIREIETPAGKPEPQVTVTEHPILSPLRQLSVSPFFLLRIRQQMEASGASVEAAGVELVASGPSQMPLMVDKGFGAGRVVGLLTGFTPDWSNWAQDPTFVVVALRTFGYLGSFRRSATSQPIGSPLEMVISGDTVLPEAEILFPAREGGMRTKLLQKVAIDSENSQIARVQLGINLGQMDRDLIDGLLKPGVFEMWVVNSQGEKLFQNFAHNVAAAEGNLERVSHRELKDKLPEIPLEIQTAEAVSGTGLNSPEAAHSTLLMALLAALLLAEQLLAYSASYHAPRFIGAAR
jgi:uncharacterized membrane protein